jgi:Reverse transcriptase (RNA-dependent DNA polymerase)/RNase H-like domain found in reverse transcriptase
VGGKLGGRAVIAAITQAGRPGRLGFLVDNVENVVYLIDTGAVYSVVPYTSDRPATGPAITAADGTAIPCWGWREVTVTAGGRVFRWRFLLAAVAFALIGSDFLVHFDLSVDLRRLQLRQRNGRSLRLQEPPRKGVFALYGIRPAVVAAEISAVPATPSTVPSPPSALHCSPPSAPHCSTTSAQQCSPPSLQRGRQPPEAVVASVTPNYVQLLAEFPAVVNPSKLLPEVKHQVEHHIITDGQPVTSKYRRLDPERLATAKSEFDALEKQGVVRRSSSNWASPLHMVKKADGSWRPCGDFRRLNLITKEDRYTCPNIGDLTARLAGCKVFSKLDLRKGYHQVPVRPEHVQKTAIITPFGLYEFLRMPFGLRNAGQTFQRMMDNVMASLPFCFIYLDDVLVASPDHLSHVQHLREVLQRLQEHGLVLNAEKCEFGVSEISYLGHRVSASGIRPLQDRLTAIQQHPQPKTVRQLQTYLGMVNFYRRFFRGAAAVLRPLTEAIRGGQKVSLTWTAEMQAAFRASKEALVAAAELAHPLPGAVLSLAVDASGSHCGAVLQQHADGGPARPLGFFSVKLELNTGYIF